MRHSICWYSVECISHIWWFPGPFCCFIFFYFDILPTVEGEEAGGVNRNVCSSAFIPSCLCQIDDQVFEVWIPTLIHHSAITPSSKTTNNVIMDRRSLWHRNMQNGERNETPAEGRLYSIYEHSVTHMRLILNLQAFCQAYFMKDAND